MSLYQKYRPQSLEELKGNSEIVSTLDRMLGDLDKCPHVFLITGHTGCGKTTIGRIIADRLEIKGHDFRELDSADFRGIDTIREIRKQSHYLPLESPRRLWLLDECHKLTGDAQNALLKMLEDPPKHVYFVLCTTDPQKLIPTIRGRCSTFQVSLLNETQIIGVLRKIIKGEEESLQKVVYEQIAQDSQGYVRNAINILEQVLSSDVEDRLKVAKKSAEEQSQSIELCRALFNSKGWKAVSNILNGLKDQDPESVRRLVLGYCQSVLLKGDTQLAGLIMEEFREPFYNTGFPGLVLACYIVVKN